MEFSRKEYWSKFPVPFPGELFYPGMESRSPTLQADSLPTEPPGKPQNTGVVSLSLFQGIFLTQESNRGLLYCKWILYQLSYQGSPILPITLAIFSVHRNFLQMFLQPHHSTVFQCMDPPHFDLVSGYRQTLVFFLIFCYFKTCYNE